MTAKPITCAELVELTTDYLESALPPAERCRVDRHLAACDGCSTYFNQLRTTIRLTSTLGRHDIEPTRVQMLTAFRRYQREV
jgi:anti-sigma factor RsiW